ncbi:MAG TPA: hypothetical protein VGR57_19295 [Ktedonobacterales bacterium]|nr:hypothetical protein [Ktedonobacterales bacterium]
MPRDAGAATDGQKFAAPRATPLAWTRAVIGLALGALPGVGMLVNSRSADLWAPLMAAIALFYLSLPLAVWQFRRPMRPGLAWGYVAGVTLATAGVLAGLFASALWH